MTLKDNIEMSGNQTVEVKLQRRGNLPVSVIKASCRMQGGCHMNKPPGDPPLVPIEQDLAKVYAFKCKLQRIIFFKQSSFLLLFPIIIIWIIYVYYSLQACFQAP